MSLKQAVDILGSQSALARAIRVKPQSVNQWLRSRVPAERVLAIEYATKGQVTRYCLRPDLYPNPTGALPPGATGARQAQPDEAAA